MSDRTNSRFLFDRPEIIEAIFEDVPDAIVLADKQREIVLTNPSLQRVFGYGADELIGKSTVSLYESEAEFERQGRLRFNLLAEGKPAVYVVNYRRKDGEVFPGETVGAVIRDAAGEVVAFLGIIRDVTRRMAAERGRAEAEQRLHDAIESLDEGFALFDADDRLVLSNRRYRQMYPMAGDLFQAGKTFEVMMREGVARGQFAIEPGQESDWIARRLEAHRNPPPEPMEQYLSDGRCILHAERRTHDGGIVGTRVDISDQKRLEKALRRLAELSSCQRLESTAKINEILRLGTQFFGLDLALVSRIEGSNYTVLYAVTPEDCVQPGQSFDLGVTYCIHTLMADQPTGFNCVGESEIREHPCYKTFGLEAYLGAPLMIDGERFGTLNFSSPEARAESFSKTEFEIIRIFSEWIAHEIARERNLMELKRTQEELARLAKTDVLTGTLNRREFIRVADTEFERARRYRRTLSVLMLDVDHFKSINDSYGHDVGDQVLITIAKTCARLLRTADVFARIGGEEFAVLLPEASRDYAVQVAERLVAALRDMRINVEGQVVTTTISVGVAQINDGDRDLQSVLKRADVALYRAKDQGRDQALAA